MINTYIALSVYIVILGIITFIASRRKSADDFLRASGKIEWKTFAVSVFASVLSSYNIVVGLTFAYLFGPWVIIIYLGVLLAFIGIYYLAKNQNTEVVISQRFNSVIDYFKNRFGNRNASVLHLSLMLVLFIFISLQFYINTTVFAQILGWDKYTSSISVGMIVLLYTFIAGLKVEIFTDVFQGILMLLVIGLVFMVDTSQISGETISPLLTDKTIIIGAISLASAQFLTLLVQPEMWQRIYATKSIAHIKKGFIASWILLMLVVIPLVIIGLSVRATGELDNPGNLFYNILETSTPQWFLPFLSVALFAAFMSSLDSSLFAISSQLGKYGFWIKSNESSNDNRDKRVVTKTRVAVVIVSILALATSLYFTDFLLYVLQLVSLLTVISTVVLFSILFKTTRNETFIGTLVALICFFYAAFSGLITEEAHTTLYPSAAVIIYMLAQTIVVRLHKLNKSK